MGKFLEVEVPARLVQEWSMNSWRRVKGAETFSFFPVQILQISKVVAPTFLYAAAPWRLVQEWRMNGWPKGAASTVCVFASYDFWNSSNQNAACR